MSGTQLTALLVAALFFGAAGYATGNLSSGSLRWARLVGIVAAILLSLLMIIPIVHGKFPFALPLTLPYLLGNAAGLWRRRVTTGDCGCQDPTTKK